VTVVHAYHDGTKHHFNRFARSLGYLDWASQPNPFRSFPGAAAFALPPRPDAAGSPRAIGAILRYSLGLSAWKQFRDSRWALRVNPSSGNLHPTEAYVVSGAGVGRHCVYHYSADRHALEERCAFDASSLPGGATFLVALTSIHWREAWKYGERAFRYCQHDLGHALAALSYAAGLEGFHARVQSEWSRNEIATLTGVDRADDYLEAEREEPGCLIALTSHQPPARGDQPPTLSQSPASDRATLLGAVRGGRWTGRANQLSEDHVAWTFIDDVARATEDPGRALNPAVQLPNDPSARLPGPAVILQRRSAVSLDGRSPIDRERFEALLSRVMPSASAPWDALWWTPRIHLALFVHRVEDLEPGMYVLPRAESATDRLRQAMHPEFLWEPVAAGLPLVRVARGACRQLARRLSCDQEIAADGFFSLGMLADFDASLDEHGPAFYRHLFWESGVVGQALYLAAEDAGARGTGIGCFYDDAVHEALGMSGHAFQSLYHFTIGIPVEDARLMTEPGYDWEAGSTSSATPSSAPIERASAE
jgi:SagB-type dehydrogenase family enzyme